MSEASDSCHELVRRECRAATRCERRSKTSKVDVQGPESGSGKADTGGEKSEERSGSTTGGSGQHVHKESGTHTGSPERGQDDQRNAREGQVGPSGVGRGS